MSRAAAAGAIARVADRVRLLLERYRPPGFEEVPGPDAGLFLAAIDHRTGYREPHRVEGAGPYDGSALLWALGLAAETRRPGTLSAAGLDGVEEAAVAELFAVGGESVASPGRRAELWRDLARGMLRRYEGSAAALIAASGGHLAGEGGLLVRLGGFEAYSDPLRKKSFLVCKIWERRGWLSVRDPGSWEVCADNVLMRLALRSGLVAAGPVERVRADTRAAWKWVAEQAEVSPPVLDDLLWEHGRDDRDLLGSEGGDLREPPRPPGTDFY